MSSSNSGHRNEGGSADSGVPDNGPQSTASLSQRSEIDRSTHASAPPDPFGSSSIEPRYESTTNYSDDPPPYSAVVAEDANREDGRFSSGPRRAPYIPASPTVSMPFDAATRLIPSAPPIVGEQDSAAEPLIAQPRPRNDLQPISMYGMDPETPITMQPRHSDPNIPVPEAVDPEKEKREAAERNQPRAGWSTSDYAPPMPWIPMVSPSPANGLAVNTEDDHRCLNCCAGCCESCIESCFIGLCRVIFRILCPCSDDGCCADCCDDDCCGDDCCGDDSCGNCCCDGDCDCDCDCSP